ncbi:acyl carrier protein phosphodiesterase [Fulvivirga sp.]|uniref:acyl carrier protein phosphodiesterase n=1 Tax=Fulvivirga sp. TaxID=1931237 RepID=UPI0032EC48F2
MNFLAHIYLSGNNEPLMVGNFIGDFVKGNQLNDFESEITRGVNLHRAIDEYTDQHPVVSKSKDKLREKYRHYSGVIVDIYYDHFLAKNWSDYHKTDLLTFTKQFYNAINNYHNILPKGAKYMLPYMMENNWLYNYSKVEGISRALGGMSRRTKFDSKMDEAVVDLRAYYDEFEKEFKEFFVDLQSFVAQWLSAN